MLPERAEEMLRDYRSCVGRSRSLEIAILSLQQQINAYMRDYAEEIASIGAQNLDGMPHGTTVGNPTERFGLMLASGHTPDIVQDMQQSVKTMREEIDNRRITILFVEAWLQGLTAKERWMIERVYFDKMSYNEINPLYREKYGECCSKDSLRRIKKEALEKIYEMAK